MAWSVANLATVPGGESFLIQVYTLVQWLSEGIVCVAALGTVLAMAVLVSVL
jgi:hypothetical protein